MKGTPTTILGNRATKAMVGPFSVKGALGRQAMAASKGPFQVLVRYYSDSTSHNAGVFKSEADAFAEFNERVVAYGRRDHVVIIDLSTGREIANNRKR